MLTGLLFGQDTTLALNNGRTITGKIISETDSTYIIESEHVLNKIFKRGIIGLMLNLNENPLTTEKEIQKVILAQPKEVGLHRKLYSVLRYQNIYLYKFCQIYALKHLAQTTSQ